MTGLFTNTTLSASALNDAINSLTLNAISSAGYTLVLADAGKLVTLSHASSQNLTIPLNATIAYATGTVIETLTIGAGTWTVVPTGGVTYTGPTSLPTGTRLRLTKTGTDTWYGSVLGGGGLTFITSSTFSAVASVSVNNCFTATYDNYLIHFSGSGSTTAQAIAMRMRVGGADNSTANYADQSVNGVAAAAGAGRNTGATSMNVGVAETGGSWFSLTVMRPALAVPTFCHSIMGWTVTSPTVQINATGHNVSTAFDGFTLTPASGTITGTLRIYGFQNA